MYVGHEHRRRGQWNRVIGGDEKISSGGVATLLQHLPILFPVKRVEQRDGHGRDAWYARCGPGAVQQDDG